MIPCPGDEHLAALLDEGLDRPDMAEVEAHLEGCARCQDVLERLTAERISAMSWPADAPAVEAAGSMVEAESAPSEPTPTFLGSTVQGEEDARRRRLVLGSAPRSPSSYRLPPDERTGPAAGGDGPASYPPQVDGYDIVGRLGRGGMGVVYRARQHGLDRLVALKMLRGGGHADPESLARFRIEVRAVARLHHPNVVQVFDVGESQGQPFVALELLEGGSLEAKIGGVPQPDAIATARLVAILARAVAAAHRAGIVHRDLKSANILFSRDGIPKITDFGLAKRLDEDDGQTESGQVMGSPSFMAPEQALGLAATIGPPADIYSLGAILYEMIAGRPPFKGGSAIETLHQVVHVEPVAPSRLRSGLPADLETICLKCLSKEVPLRYATADLLADDLERFAAGVPIHARRVRPLERARKWARRHPTVVALATSATLLVGLTAGVGWWTWEAHRGRVNRITDLRREGPELLRWAHAAIADRRYGDARERLGQFAQEAQSLPELADLRRQAEGLLADAGRGEADRGEDARARARRDEFLRLTRLARLADAHWLLAEVAIGADPRPVRAAAEVALAAAGGLDRLDPADRSEVDLARLELELLRLDAIGSAAPGEDPVARAMLALSLLDGGGVARPGGQAGLYLRSRLEARAGQRERAAATRARAEATATVDELDRIAAGRDWQERGDWPRAIAEYQAALRRDANQSRADLSLAICELLAGHPETARAQLANCLRQDPGSVDLLILSGVAAGQAGSLALGRPPGSEPAGRQRAEADLSFQAAEEDFRHAEASGPAPHQRAALLAARGVVRVRASRLNDALRDFADALRIEPDHVAARVNLGQVLQRLGRTDEAIAAFDHAIRLDPGRARVRWARAVARLERHGPVDQSELRAARDDLDEAIRRAAPGSADLASFLAQRARLHHRSHDLAAALADAEAALRIGPGDLETALVRIHTLLDLGRPAEVIEACDEALARRPDRVDLWELRGVARSNRRDFVRAIDDFTRAIALEPGRVSARLQRGWAYLVYDAPKLALADFQAAVERSPDLPEAYAGRGFALALDGEPGAAVADAEESLRRGRAQDPRTLYNAARIYARSAQAVATRASSRLPGRPAGTAAEYEERALTLTRAALDATAPGRRASFWSEVVQGDPAFAAIRQRSQFARLAGQAARSAQ